VAVILTACSRQLPTPEGELPAPPERLIHDPRILEHAPRIILVRVTGLEMLDRQWNEIPEHTKMLVLKSWKGLSAAGDVLHTPEGFIFHHGKPDDNRFYHFQFGDRGKEFLMMSSSGNPEMPDVVFVRRSWVWPAAKSQALMAALDQAVADSMPTDKAGYAGRLQKEEAAIKDVEAKLQAAQSNRAPDDQIRDLSTQLRGHQENAWRFRIARDYLDKHPEKSGESVDSLAGAAHLEMVTAAQKAAPH
jgi:hypothetical protein